MKRKHEKSRDKKMELLLKIKTKNFRISFERN